MYTFIEGTRSLHCTEISLRNLNLISYNDELMKKPIFTTSKVHRRFRTFGFSNIRLS